MGRWHFRAPQVFWGRSNKEVLYRAVSIKFILAPSDVIKNLEFEHMIFIRPYN